MDSAYRPLPSTPTAQPIRRRRRLSRVIPSRCARQILAAVLSAMVVAAAAWVYLHRPVIRGILPDGPGVPDGTPAGAQPLLGNHEAGPVVALGYVKYQGLWQANGIAEFTGMRYAKAPLGDLRWRAPADPAPQRGLRRATQFGKSCYATGRGVLPSQSEDCLFVNVWTPARVTSATKLPVWVFIQGGGYNSNSAGDTRGSEIVASSGYNAVVVTFNYRVSLWGFLAGEAVRSDGALNAGLLDQRRLLHWVQEHIAKFGGDPAQVMLHGHSAGAGSVAHHLTAYSARNDSLFTSALLQSPFFPPQPTVADVEWQFNATAQLVGCDAAQQQQQQQQHNVLACLRRADAHVLQDRANRVRASPGKTGAPIFYWAPVTDGEFVRGDVARAMNEGRYVPVPLVAGTVNNEGSTFGSEAGSFDQLVDFVSDNFPRFNASWPPVLSRNYPLPTAIPGHAAWFLATSQSYADAVFSCPLLLSTAVAAASRPPIWMYRYNVTDDTQVARGEGVPHGADLPAFFGASSTAAPQSYFTYNAQVAALVMSHMVSFVRARDPNVFRDGATAAEWPEWRPETKTRMVFERGNVRTEQVGEDVQQRCREWEGLLG